MKRVLSIVLGWGWAATIVWLSVTPAPPAIDFSASDKVGHVLAYGLLMLWFCLLYDKKSSRLAYAATFIAMGIALEFVQRELGYRTFELLDMAANAVGVLLAWGVAILPVMKRFRLP